MTISHEYAEELGRQIDELEAENERLRSLIPTEPQEVVTVALKKLIDAVKTYQFTPDDCPEKPMAACDLDDAVDEAKAALAQPQTAAKTDPLHDSRNPKETRNTIVNAFASEAMRKALNYIENTESELGIKLSCGDALREALAAQPPAAPVEMETCGICMGSGYSNHPDSGEICATCNGSGGVAPLQRLSAGMRP